MTGREPAWRVFANELSEAIEEERGAGERAVSFLVSPQGGRLSRVLLSGLLSTSESIGKDESQPFYRARLNDPTGSVSIAAGGFQPRALAVLRNHRLPNLALVVGRTHLYRGRDGTLYPSVRAEAIRSLSEEQYRNQLTETLDQTLRRIDLVERARNSPRTPASDDDAPEPWKKGADAAALHYPTIPAKSLRSALRPVLTALESPGPLLAGPVSTGTVRVTHVSPAPVRPPRSTEDRTAEALFLEVLEEVAEPSPDGYADLKELFAQAARRGIPMDRAEAILNRLEEDGAVEEPIVGRLRRAEGSPDARRAADSDE